MRLTILVLLVILFGCESNRFENRVARVEKLQQELICDQERRWFKLYEQLKSDCVAQKSGKILCLSKLDKKFDDLNKDCL